MTVLYTLRFAAAAVVALLAAEANAAIVCNVSSSGFTAYYFENDTNPTNGTGSFTVSCTRAAGDPTTFGYTVGSSGLNWSGTSSRAFAGTGGTLAERMNYNRYLDASFSQRWGNTSGRFTGTVNFGSAATLFTSETKTYYYSIPAGQNKIAAMFTDTVTMSLCNAAGTVCGTGGLTNGTFPVTINNTSLCLLSTPPGNITFGYTSFQASAATASAAYAVRCTIGQTYTMALDATAGTLLNLNYTLALSNPAGQTGTGFPQNFTINGSIAGGQSGTCATGACTSAPQQRTLTITY